MDTDSADKATITTTPVVTDATTTTTVEGEPSQKTAPEKAAGRRGRGSPKKKATPKKVSAIPKVGDGAEDESKHKRHRKARYTEYDSYIHKIVTELHPDVGVNSDALGVLNAYSKDLLHRIMSKSADMARYKHTHTVSPFQIATATYILFSKPLASRLVKRGTKAVTTFKASSPEKAKTSADAVVVVADK